MSRSIVEVCVYMGYISTGHKVAHGLISFALRREK